MKGRPANLRNKKRSQIKRWADALVGASGGYLFHTTVIMKITTTIFASLAAISLFAGADWPGFRGSDSTAVAANSNPPLEWSEDTGVAWKKSLPGRGAAGTIVVDGKVFVTASSPGDQDRLYVLCFDAKSGDELWRREFWATGRTSTHPSSAVAAPTPVSDGKHIFAFYSSNDLICLDLKGNLKWYRGLSHDYPKSGNDVGMASSPTISGGNVIVQVESQGDSFATGISIETGETQWKIERPKISNWASPVVVPKSGSRKETVLLTSKKGLTLVDPQSGETLWNYETEVSGVPSAVAVGDRFYVAANGLTCFELPADSFAAEVKWDNGKIRPSSASPVITADKIYVLDRGGIVTCASIDGDKIFWKLRLKGTFWATPVLAGKHLYCLSYDGNVQVVDISGDKGEIVSTNPADASLQGSPAAAGDAIYFRSHENLWKIAK